jgi:hypothetical protein
VGLELGSTIEELLGRNSIVHPQTKATEFFLFMQSCPSTHEIQGEVSGLLIFIWA